MTDTVQVDTPPAEANESWDRYGNFIKVQKKLNMQLLQLGIILTFLASSFLYDFTMVFLDSANELISDNLGRFLILSFSTLAFLAIIYRSILNFRLNKIQRTVDFKKDTFDSSKSFSEEGYFKEPFADMLAIALARDHDEPEKVLESFFAKRTVHKEFMRSWGIGITISLMIFTLVLLGLKVFNVDALGNQIRDKLKDTEAVANMATQNIENSRRSVANLVERIESQVSEQVTEATKALQVQFSNEMNKVIETERDAANKKMNTAVSETKELWGDEVKSVQRTVKKFTNTIQIETGKVSTSSAPLVDQINKTAKDIAKERNTLQTTLDELNSKRSEIDGALQLFNEGLVEKLNVRSTEFDNLIHQKTSELEGLQSNIEVFDNDLKTLMAMEKPISQVLESLSADNADSNRIMQYTFNAFLWMNPAMSASVIVMLILLLYQWHLIRKIRKELIT